MSLQYCLPGTLDRFFVKNTSQSYFFCSYIIVKWAVDKYLNSKQCAYVTGNFTIPYIENTVYCCAPVKAGPHWLWEQCVLDPVGFPFGARFQFRAATQLVWFTCVSVSVSVQYMSQTLKTVGLCVCVCVCVCVCCWHRDKHLLLDKFEYTTIFVILCWICSNIYVL